MYSVYIIDPKWNKISSTLGECIRYGHQSEELRCTVDHKVSSQDTYEPRFTPQAVLYFTHTHTHAKQNVHAHLQNPGYATVIKSHHVMMTFLVFDLDVLFFIPCYYRPRFYLGLFCFCSSYTLLFIYLFIYLFILWPNCHSLPHCISKTNNKITIKFLVHTQQCLTTCRCKNLVTFTDDLDP